MNVNTLNAPIGSLIVPGVSSGAVNLGNDGTPRDPGLKPQSVDEVTAGVEFEVRKDVTIGVRGIYRNMGNVVEDGSFNDGDTYFIFNPGRRGDATHGLTTEDQACAGDPNNGRAPRCFGPAQRFYRALEFTATNPVTNNYQFISSYVFSILIGNNEGLFRTDNRQSDPNITPFFSPQHLLHNTYQRIPNNRP